MSDHERFDQLSRLIDAQRAVCERLYREWTEACKGLNNFEREQSAIFRRMASPQPPAHGQSEAP